jgi:putative membrane protein
VSAEPPVGDPAETGTPEEGAVARHADGGAEHRTNLADRRTTLANERTLLAWWRTGLTSLAVALGVGRLLPELAHDSTHWPFVVIGVAFALYGIAFFLYGTRRSGERDASLIGRSGDPALTALTVFGALLGVASAVLILTQ